MNTEEKKDEELDEDYLIVKHLAENYMNGIWGINIYPNFSKDIIPIQEKYEGVKKDTVERYEKNLNKKLISFLKLRGKVTSKEFGDVLKYKLYQKPKNKLVCYLWDIDYTNRLYGRIRNIKP